MRYSADMDEHTSLLKGRLEEELAEISESLRSVGRRNPEDPTDWEPAVEEAPLETLSDDEERAGSIEDFEDAVAIEAELEKRERKIRRALERIGDGAYSSCLVCGQKIETARHDANPAAATCIAHKNED